MKTDISEKERTAHDLISECERLSRELRILTRGHLTFRPVDMNTKSVLNWGEAAVKIGEIFRYNES